MHRSFAVVAAVLTGATIGRAQSPADVQATRAGIAATWGAFKSQWVAGNAGPAVEAFFTDDAINMQPAAASDSGKAAITKSFTPFLATNKVTGIKQTTDEVRVSGRMAYERGTFVQSQTAANGQASTLRARYLAIWVHQPDGKWKCSRFLFNELPQPKQGS